MVRPHGAASLLQTLIFLTFFIACKSIPIERQSDHQSRVILSDPPASQVLPPPPPPSPPTQAPGTQPMVTFEEWAKAEVSAPWLYSFGSRILAAAPIDGGIFLWERNNGPMVFDLTSKRFVAQSRRVSPEFVNADPTVFYLAQPFRSSVLVLRSDGRMLISNPRSPDSSIETQLTRALDTIVAFAVSGDRAYVVGMKGAVYHLKIFSLQDPTKPVEVSGFVLATLPSDIQIDGATLLLSGRNSCDLYDLKDPIKPTLVSSTEIFGGGADRYCAHWNSYVYMFAGGSLSIFSATNLKIPLSLATVPSISGKKMILYYDRLRILGDDNYLSEYKIGPDGIPVLQTISSMSLPIGTWVHVSNFLVSMPRDGGIYLIQPSNQQATVEGFQWIWGAISATWVQGNTLSVVQAGQLYQVPFSESGRVAESLRKPSSFTPASSLSEQSIYIVAAESQSIGVYDTRAAPWAKLNEYSFQTPGQAKNLESVGERLGFTIDQGVYLKKDLASSSVPEKIFSSIRKHPEFCFNKTHAFISDDRVRIVDLQKPAPNNLIGSLQGTFRACLASEDRLLIFNSDKVIQYFDLKSPGAPHLITSIKHPLLSAARRAAPSVIFWESGLITGYDYLKNFTEDADLNRFLSKPDIMNRWILEVTDQSIRGRRWEPWK